MACRLVGARPLHIPMTEIRHLGKHFNELLIKIHFRKKSVWMCCLWNVGHFVSALMRYMRIRPSERQLGHQLPIFFRHVAPLNDYNSHLTMLVVKGRGTHDILTQVSHTRTLKYVNNNSTFTFVTTHQHALRQILMSIKHGINGRNLFI